MAYAELKEKLERLLTEDLSNRSTLQDARRNLFLNSEGAKVQQQLLADKQGEIASLSLLVEKKKTILQLKDDQINVVKEQVKELEGKLAAAEGGFTAEKAVLSTQISELEAKLTEAQAEFASEKAVLSEKITSLEEQVIAGSAYENKLTALSFKNEEFSMKIEELTALVESKRTEIENLKKELAEKVQNEVSSSVLEEKDFEIERLQEKSDLLFESEQQLKVLVSAQNNEIEALTKQTNGFKKQIEDIASGWQQQQDQLLMDNSNLLAEIALVKEAAAQTESISSSAQELESLKAEKEALSTINLNLFAEITALKETNASLLTEMGRVREDITGQSEAVSSATKEIESLKAEKEALATVNLNLFTEIASLKETISNSGTTQNTTAPTDDVLAAIRAEKESLVATNVSLLAEISALKEAGPQSATMNGALTEEQIAEIKAEKEHLATELAAISHELNIVTQNREEKIISLQNEIGTLQNQLISLSNTLNQETEEKNQISNQVEQLTNIVTEKEQQLNGLSNNKADEEFIDKLMQQINLLNDQKHSFETMYHDSEAELSLTKANLASLTQLVEGQKTSISGLEETNKHVKLAQTLMLQVNDKTVAKQAINELVREIDRCIALLSE